MSYKMPPNKPTFRCGNRVWLVMPYNGLAIKCTVNEVQSGVQVCERAEFKDADGKVYPYKHNADCHKEGEIWFYWVDEPTGHASEDLYQFRERGKPINVSEFSEYIIKTKQEAIEILKLFPIRKKHIRNYEYWRERSKRFIGSTQIMCVVDDEDLRHKWHGYPKLIPEEILEKTPVYYQDLFPKRKKNEVIYRFEL